MAGNNPLRSQIVTSNGKTDLKSQFATSSFVYHFDASFEDLGIKRSAFPKFDKDAFKLLGGIVEVVGE